MENIEAKKSIYSKLIEAVDALPKESVETAKKTDTRKGYDTTGYQYQYLVNVLNEVVGLGNWGMTWAVLKEQKGQYTNGKEFFDITSSVTVWIMNDDKKAEFTNVGGHQSPLYNDALKGSITNGFKKTVSYFGIGKKAYEGTLDEDYRAQEEIKTPTTAPIVKPVAVRKATIVEVAQRQIRLADTEEKINLVLHKIAESEKFTDEEKEALYEEGSRMRDEILFGLSEK